MSCHAFTKNSFWIISLYFLISNPASYLDNYLCYKSDFWYHFLNKDVLHIKLEDCYTALYFSAFHLHMKLNIDAKSSNPPNFHLLDMLVNCMTQSEFHLHDKGCLHSQMEDHCTPLFFPVFLHYMLMCKNSIEPIVPNYHQL